MSDDRMPFALREGEATLRVRVTPRAARSGLTDLLKSDVED
jgi:hypothetical protein